jgi:hypothetical protein
MVTPVRSHDSQLPAAQYVAGQGALRSQGPPSGSPLRPSFLITIDTEGDNEWARPKRITTHNARFLSRFQKLCETHGLKPTYLTNYEMARCPDFQEFGRDALRRETAEIGLHLHAWTSPPLIPLTRDDLEHHPFLIEWPDQVMRDKVHYLDDLLEDAFNVKMVSHRAGRWAFDGRYARLLAERGYLVDCSVTPFMSRRHETGAPDGSGGTDYTQFPDTAYFLNLDDISRPGSSSLLEVPVTVIPRLRPFARTIRRLTNGPRLPRAAINRLFPVAMLRPERGNLREMLGILQQARAEGRDYVEFMIHSSELMPGGSPYFPAERDVEALYEDMEQVFDVAGRSFQGKTLKEYHQSFTASRSRSVGAA